MKLKNRYTTWNLRLVTLNKAQQCLRRRKEYNFKLSLSDILMSISAILLIDADSVIANFAREGVVWQVAAEWTLLALFFLGIFLKFRHRAPRPCWNNLSWALSMMAVGCTIVAYAMWWLDEFTLVQSHIMALCCVPIYVGAIASIVRLHYIRRRSRAEIAMMRMRRSRRRNYDY